MNARRSYLALFLRWSKHLAILVVFVAGVILIMLKLAGKFDSKAPSSPEKAAETQLAPGAKLVKAYLRPVDLTESAVGSIRAVHETSIGAKLLARVVEVNIKAGQAVHEGDVLIRMDDSDIKPQLEQANSALAKAEASYQQATNDEKRYAELVKVNAISKQEYENAVTRVRTADAELKRAKEAIKEVQAKLEFATIRAPISGIIIDKKVDVGDMVAPGQILATLFDPNRMQMVASVREALAHKLNPGQTIGVQVDSLGKQCSGMVSEIVPEAQTTSRSFQVKVTGPCPSGVYSGMYGRILIPLGREKVLVILRNAIQNVGQLELVDVAEDGHIVRRAVRTGRVFGKEVEILSGLREGEQVVVPAGASVAKEGSHE